VERPLQKDSATESNNSVTLQREADRIAFEPETEYDPHQAFDWYEQQRSGLGREFLEFVEEVLKRLSEMPESRAVDHRNARLALVKRFPYVVCYLVDDDAVYAMAVFLGHRDPETWRERIRYPQADTMTHPPLPNLGQIKLLRPLARRDTRHPFNKTAQDGLRQVRFTRRDTTTWLSPPNDPKHPSYPNRST
jgi:plasmid stabilization system protein ParE